MIDTKKSERERERDKRRFPLEFNEETKNRTKSMKVTSTIQKCIFVPLAEKEN